MDRGLLDELHRLDRAVYEAVGGARTPTLDEAFGRLSRTSGHAAAAFAFATAAGRQLPAVALPLGALATLVSYSRIHTGVHYPTDVVVGALCGVALAEVGDRGLDRLASR